MLLRDVMMPLPMREDWGPDMEWPYPGIPAAWSPSSPGTGSPGLPFFAPETVTTDHGCVYRNHALVEASGCSAATSCRPGCCARPTRPPVERAFGVIRQLLFEQLPGYTGIDVADRGADPEADAVLTMDEMEHLIAAWIVGIWQQRASWASTPRRGTRRGAQPEHAVRRGDRAGRVRAADPRPELFYELLPVHYVSASPAAG